MKKYSIKDELIEKAEAEVKKLQRPLSSQELKAIYEEITTARNGVPSKMLSQYIARKKEGYGYRPEEQGKYAYGPHGEVPTGAKMIVSIGRNKYIVVVNE